jgi:hypothetical protein
MEQREYLKKQIDQLGKVLAKAFSDLLGLKNSGQINVGFELTNQTLKNELGCTIQDLLDTPTDTFIDTITTDNNVTHENLEILADILLLLAENRQEDNKTLFEKCLMIYTYLEKAETVYSVERHQRMTRIKNILFFEKK